MIDVNKLNDRVREAIINNKFGSDEEEPDFDRHIEPLIKGMSVRDAFTAYCEWHGIINYAEHLIEALDNIRAASDERKVYVVMGNDFPGSVFDTEKGADAHIEKLQAADRAEGVKHNFKGTGYYRIYWRSYEFKVRS